ncbi:MAG: FtsW/RodA/SpoVE family cell cycle protein [Candidatus Wolfebacteria bacterium]|nr:FtsW/RodA/SpoVE family cell cycle protein [Candidatus Wolfebacteria bacterium]
MPIIEFFSGKGMDWKLNLSVLFLIAASLTSFLSNAPISFRKQIVWIIIGVALIFLISRFDLRPFINYKGIIFGIYFLGLLFLAAAFFFAPSIRGARAWIALGDFRFEPSEYMKFALIILYSVFFSRKHAAIARISNLLVSFIYFAVPAALIALQPDFGSVAILFLIWVGFLLVSGIKWKHLLIVILIFSILGVFMWHSFLKPYQKDRIMGFLFPGRDPLGINYSVIQAKTAIGSGGFFGKGFGQGTQSQLGFLPEKQTDFIFSAIIEEWGLFGGFLVLAAFAFAVFRIIGIGFKSQNNFGRLVCLGAAILFLSQFILNVGSNIGFTPVIGVTFPFLSYGGSSLLIDMILLGIIQSVFIRRTS